MRTRCGLYVATYISLAGYIENKVGLPIPSSTLATINVLRSLRPTLKVTCSRISDTALIRTPFKLPNGAKYDLYFRDKLGASDVKGTGGLNISVTISLVG